MPYVDVSVIIPAYNCASALRRCLESVFAQRPQPSQIIVVNDGSSDDTEAAARTFGEAITYIFQENQGQGAARNAGLAAAKGEFVAFLDADDYWLPDFLSRCVGFLEEQREAVAVSTGRIIKKPLKEDAVWPARGDAQIEQGPRVLDDFFAFWAKHDHVRTGTVLMRSRVIRMAGQQRADLRISQDLEYWALLATYGPWGFLPEPLWVSAPLSTRDEASLLHRYTARRRLCPSVEAWEARVVPRLTPAQMSSFRTIRGRVAHNFAHTYLLAGREAEARAAFLKYGHDMPCSWVVRLLRITRPFGRLGDWGAGATARLREWFKHWRIERHRRSARDARSEPEVAR